MTPIFRTAQEVPIGEPGQLGSQLFTFARRRRDRHRKAIRVYADDRSFEPPEMVNIGNDPLTLCAINWFHDRHAAGRHVDDLARELTPIRQHISAKQIDTHALKASPLIILWQV